MRHFYRHAVFFPLLLSLSGLAALYFFVIKKITLADPTAYQKAISYVGGTSSLASGKFVQKRNGVYKELWQYQEGERFPVKMVAKQSELHLDETEGFSERFEHAVCTMEESVGASLLKADQMHYTKNEAFLEGKVEFRNPSGTMRCQKAKTLWDHNVVKEIQAWGKVMLRHVDGWKIDADRALWDLQSEKVFFFANPQHQIFFQDGERKIYADYAELELSSHVCTLEGEVKLVHREAALKQSALADRVVFLQEKEELHFFAAQGKRTLFFDAANHLQMSATELKVSRDPFTHKEKVQGIGDVRFRLSEQEFQRLKNIANY